MILIKLIGLACFTYLMVNSEPTNRLKSMVGFDVMDEQGWRGFISRLLDCCLCLGFYIGLIGTGNLLYASIVAVMAEFINNKILNQ
jgi:hypothetical protein